MDRREVLQRLMGAVGAGFAFPALPAAHPMRRHLGNHARVAAADAKAGAAAVKPEFLDARQLESLTSVAERILPGSTSARVAPFIDQLLAVDTQENQREFLRALDTLQDEAMARDPRGWSSLSDAQQLETLTAASTAEPAGADKPPTLRDRFEHLKGWIVGAYYSSEIGMRELGWTGSVFFESFPGCVHPGGHR